MEYPFRLVGVVEKEAVAQYGPSLRSPLLARAIPLTGYNGGDVSPGADEMKLKFMSLLLLLPVLMLVLVACLSKT